MLKMRIILLAVLLSLVFVPWVRGQGSKERVYIWDFVNNDGQQTDLTARITSEFEEALIEAKCFQVLERRRFDKLLAHIKNEKAIADLNDISRVSQGEVKKITNAQVVVFGRVDDDVDSGQIKISVSFQHFDSSKEVKSVRIPRGQRLDAESRENAMKKLVKEICDNSPSQPPPRTKPAASNPNEINKSDVGGPDIERIESGTSRRGSIAEGQTKEYKFAGVANVALRFSLQKQSTPRYTTRYVAEIYDSRGQQLKRTMVYAVKGQVVTFTPQTDGWYIFRLTGEYGYSNYTVYLDIL